MNERLIEIEALKNGETQFFDDVYADSLQGQMGDILGRFVKQSKGANKLIVYLSEDEPIQIWEKEITDFDKATKLLDIFREIVKLTKKDMNE
jgi:hypothetical protein